MSMHLEGPALTTTSYKKRKEKITKAKQAELEQGWRDRNQRLKQMGLPKETLEQYIDWVYGRGKKEKEKTNDRQKVTPSSSELSSPQSADKKNPTTVSVSFKREWITGAVSSPPSKTYTGTKVKGIATMHKSNLVPIFTDEAAIDIARMRR